MAQIVRLTGFRELERALEQLPKATGKNVLRRVARGALEPMADVAAAKAPHRTGRLSFSIVVSEKRTARAKATQFGFRFNPSTGITMAMGPAAGFGAALSYASFDEFGTIDTPAFAYMRSAWRTGSGPALRYIIQHLGFEIQKSARKHVAKRLKVA